MEETKRKTKFIMKLLYVIELIILAGGIAVATVMSNYLVLGVVVAVIGFILFIATISSYNKMIKYKNKVDESLALIDIHLKLRFDLIPNLVNTVKGYAKHEKETLAEVTELRSKAKEVVDKKELIDLANEVLPKMKYLIAIAEDYPDLKASAVFKQLMDEMILIEDKIVASRRFYDSNVSEYNTLIEKFPQNIVASGHGFKKMELYRIDAGERLNVKVDI